MLARLLRLALLCLCVASLGMAENARAQTADDAVRDEARALAKDGIAALDEGRYRDALDKLRQAEAKFHAPTHLLFIARAHAKLGEHRLAYDKYVDILVEAVPNYASEAFHKAKKAAADEIGGVQANLATLRIQVSGASPDNVEVSVDGSAVARERIAYPVAVDAGMHKVEAMAGGSEPASQDVEATIGQTATVTLALEALADDAPKPSGGSAAGGTEGDSSGLPIAAGVAFGIGGAALVVGGITGGLTLSRADDIKSTCNDNSCPPDQETEADDAKVLGNVSTAMFIVGGVGVAAGIVLLIANATGGDESTGGKPGPTLRARISPTGLALSGTF